MDFNFKLEISVIKAFELSKSLMLNTVLIPRNVFVVCLFIIPGTEINAYICYNAEKSPDEIYECALNYLNKLELKPVEDFYNFTIGDDMVYTVEESILDLLKTANKIARNSYGQEIISISHLVAAYADSYYDEYMKLMNYFISDFEYRKTTKKVEPKFIIPQKLQSFLTNMNEKYSKNEKECKICGRDSETKQLLRTLLKTNKRNAVLVGEPGVGKTALVEKLTWLIVTGNCPDKLKSSVVLALDVNAIVAGTKYRGTAEERFSDLINFLQTNPNCILFVDEVHLLLGAGACKPGEIDLANSLKPILARGDTRVIGATTCMEYEEYFSTDGALKRRFEKIIINEPNANEVYNMIKNQIKFLERSHGGITISKKMVDFAILNSSAFNYETCNPDRTLDLIDRSLVSAELSNRKTVSRSNILENFAYNTKLFKKMSSAQKMSTAYHEAGHYILYRFSPMLSDINILAVSIMPTDSYLGVNVLESNDTIFVNHNYAYYIQLIGCYLAGRIAEETYTNKLNSGASSDLEKATTLAKNMVTQYGLGGNFTHNRTYNISSSKGELYTDDLILSINKQIDRILDAAYIYAKTTLAEYQKQLELLASELVAKGLLSDKDINKLLESL